MKKGFLLVFLLCMAVSLFADNSEKELRDTMKNFATTANELGEGSGFLGVTFDPLGFQNVMVTANFKLIGVWGAELSGGYSIGKKAFAIEIDILNLNWQFPIGEKMACGLGVGCPITGTIGGYGDVFAVKPCADLRFHFFADKNYGLSIFARPGFIIDFQNEENRRISCPVGIMWRLPSSFISEAISSVL